MDLFIVVMKRKKGTVFERESEKLIAVEETGNCPSEFVFLFESI